MRNTTRSAARPWGAALATVALCTTAATVAVAAPASSTGPALPADVAAAPDVPPPVVADPAPTTDRIIVRYRTTAAAAGQGELGSTELEAALGGVGGQVEHVRGLGTGGEVWQLDDDVDVDVLADLTAEIEADNPDVAYAEPDLLLQPAAAPPNDPRWSELWGLQSTGPGLDVLGAWDTTRGAGATVAVIDTGYVPHPDLDANLLPGYDMISSAAVAADGNGRDSDARDPGDNTAAGQCRAGEPARSSSWHGTHVAGTVAASAGNSTGVAGVAPAAKVVPVRVLGKCGGYTSDIADAVVWAAGGSVPGVPANPNPADVLNLSLGGSGACGATTQQAFNTARSLGALAVVASGNSSQDAGNHTPSNCAGVVSVASYDSRGARSSFSNYGTTVDLAAPGSAILSTYNTGRTGPASSTYASNSGTSMATPHVAGVAALVVAARPGWSAAQVEQVLVSSAQPFVASCGGCGAGMVDAAAAVRAAGGGSTPTPTPTATTPTPTPTPTSTPPVGCGAAWDPGTVYVGGDRVSHGSRSWEAKWWTVGEEPGTTGRWGVWRDLGPC